MLVETFMLMVFYSRLSDLHNGIEQLTGDLQRFGGRLIGLLKADQVSGFVVQVHTRDFVARTLGLVVHHGQGLLGDLRLLRRIADVIHLVDVAVGQGFVTQHAFFRQISHGQHVS